MKQVKVAQILGSDDKRRSKHTKGPSGSESVESVKMENVKMEREDSAKRLSRP